MITKNLYQVWYQGIENISKQKYTNNMEQWKLLNPDWNYKLLDEHDLRDACRLYSKECLKAFNKTTNMHARIDLGRLVKIYLTGGMNVDMDMYILRPISYQDDITKFLNDSSKEHQFAVSSLTTLNALENLIIHGKSGNAFNNAMTISSKGNPLLGYIIDKYCDLIISLQESDGGMMYVDKTTGPRNFNKFAGEALELYKDVINFKIFNGEVFEPCSSDQMCSITDKTIAIHNFDWSWIDPRFVPLFRFYMQNRLVIYVLILLIVYKIIKYIRRLF